MPKQRLYYFDMLKGLAIFMVVMGHVLTMCIRDIDRAVLFKLIGEVHMPLFFFISGWFTARLGRTGGLQLPNMTRRAMQLLVPMIVVSTLWIWCFPHLGLQSPLNSTFDGLWHDMWKNGYWFTLVLFEIIALYAVICKPLGALKNLWLRVFLVVGFWCLMWFAVNRWIPQDIVAAGSLTLTVMFFPAFMFGALARLYSTRFIASVSKSYVYTPALVLMSVLLYLVSYSWEFAFMSLPMVYDIARFLLHATLAIVGLAIVMPWSERAYSPKAGAVASGPARIWTMLGVESLGIYLLHYFFLFPLTFMQQPLRDMGLDFVPTFVVAFVVAAIVVAVTMGVISIIKKSTMLSMLLLGKS